MTNTDPIKALVGLEAQLQEQYNKNYNVRPLADTLHTILAAIEALKPLADGTHVVVPREPTEAMLNAELGLRTWDNLPSYESRRDLRPTIWKAMLAAAPAASPAPSRFEIDGTSQDFHDCEGSDAPTLSDEGRMERIVKAFERVLLDIDFAIEQGILPDIMNDMIYVEARAALAAIKGVE